MVTKYGQVSETLDRQAKLEWVPIELMKVNPFVQRRLRQRHVAEIEDNFDIDLFGYLTVSHRDGFYYVCDGNHRLEAIKGWFGDWSGQQLEAVVYQGLSEREEGRLFLELNRHLVVSSFDRFRAALHAGYPDPVAVNRIATKNGVVIGDRGGNARGSRESRTQCTSALLRVYNEGGATVLDHTLATIMEAYGGPGLLSNIINGIGMLLNRFGAQVHYLELADKLGKTGGTKALQRLLNDAEHIKQTTGMSLVEATAAAAYQIHLGRKGSKLAWLKGDYE